VQQAFAQLAEAPIGEKSVFSFLDTLFALT
jgi:hypothetical protein